MQSELKILKSEFENEMWLYLDGSLPRERKEFWDKKFLEYPELKVDLMETGKVLDAYNEFSDDDILDSKFEVIVKNSTRQKKHRLMNFLRSDDKTVKLAFGGTLAAASIVILLLSNKPNPVKNISSDLLDWNPENINTQLNDIGKTILFIKDEDAKKYFQEKLANDKWTRDVYNINRSIQKMKSEINESSF